MKIFFIACFFHFNILWPVFLLTAHDRHGQDRRTRCYKAAKTCSCQSSLHQAHCQVLRSMGRLQSQAWPRACAQAAAEDADEWRSDHANLASGGLWNDTSRLKDLSSSSCQKIRLKIIYNYQFNNKVKINLIFGTNVTSEKTF